MAEKDRKLNREFHMHLSENELEMLTDKAAYCNTTKTGYVRRMISDGVIIKVETDAIINLTYEINRIGNNVNQIAYIVNSEKCFNQFLFERLQDEYKKLFDVIAEKIMGL